MRSSSSKFIVILFAALGSALLPAASFAQVAPTDCPQPRFTGIAPADYLSRVNPLAAGDDNAKAGAALFLGRTRGTNCSLCHGKNGDGKGALSNQYDPPPRNFACAKTVSGVPDGQLFWIIRYGSPTTAMPPHPSLKDDQIWQLVTHLRTFAK